MEVSPLISLFFLLFIFVTRAHGIELKPFKAVQNEDQQSSKPPLKNFKESLAAKGSTITLKPFSSKKNSSTKALAPKAKSGSIPKEEFLLNQTQLDSMEAVPEDGIDLDALINDPDFKHIDGHEKFKTTVEKVKKENYTQTPSGIQRKKEPFKISEENTFFLNNFLEYFQFKSNEKEQIHEIVRPRANIVVMKKAYTQNDENKPYKNVAPPPVAVKSSDNSTIEILTSVREEMDKIRRERPSVSFSYSEAIKRAPYLKPIFSGPETPKPIAKFVDRTHEFFNKANLEYKVRSVFKNKLFKSDLKLNEIRMCENRKNIFLYDKTPKNEKPTLEQMSSKKNRR